MIRNGERGRIPGQPWGLGGQGEAVILTVSFEDPKLKEREKKCLRCFNYYLLFTNAQSDLT